MFFLFHLKVKCNFSLRYLQITLKTGILKYLKVLRIKKAKNYFL